MSVNTDVKEFERFHNQLIKNNPQYHPHYVLLKINGKEPIADFGKPELRLNFDVAKEKMAKGHNIGIAGTSYDGLVIIDVDDREAFADHTFIDTLKCRSSSRVGDHYFYNTFDTRCKVNTALTDVGELRTNWQYVVCPGSFVDIVDAVDKIGNITKTREQFILDIPENDRVNAGKYTVENESGLNNIGFEGIPDLFKRAEIERAEIDKEIVKKRAERAAAPKQEVNNNNSAIYGLKIGDVINVSTDENFASVFHGSKTGKNTKIEGDLLHCFRCQVSHTALTALACLAGMYNCVDAGTGHKGSGSGMSQVDTQDGETIFKLWKYAIDNGYIPENDKIPAKALVYYAISNGICNESDVIDGWKLTPKAYAAALNLLNGVIEPESIEPQSDIIEISTSVLIEEIKKIDKPAELVDKKRVIDKFIEEHCGGMPFDELETFIYDTIKREFDIQAKKDLDSIVKKHRDIDKANKKRIMAHQNSKKRELIENGTGEQWNGINIPKDYEIKDDKLCSIVYVEGQRELKTICNTPVVIAKTGTNTDDDSYWLNVLIKDTYGTMHDKWITQKEALTRSGVMELTNSGLIVPESKASELNTYFSELMPINKNVLINEMLVSTNGWKNNGTVYVSGACGYSVGNKKHKIVHVRPESKKGLNAKGTLEDWYDGLKPILKYDVIRFKMYASLAPPLLRALNQQSCIVDDAKDTSVGKTFGCNVGMSLFGDPFELILNGDSTKTYSEVKATQYNDHALLIDELGTQNNDDALQALIYMIGNGQGRGRGTKDLHIRDTNTWKTIAMTTGESPITSRTSFGGLLVRVIELKCRLPDGLGKEVEHGYNTLKENHGLIAPLYYNAMFQNMEGLQGLFDKAKSKLSNVTDNASKRLSSTFACINVAGILLEDVFKDCGFETCDPFKVVQNVFQDSVINTPMENYSLRALHVVMDYIHIHDAEFGINGDNPKNKNLCNGYIQSDIIDVVPSMIKDVLDKNKYAPSRVFEEWAEMGIITVNKGRLDFSANHTGKYHRYTRINLDIVKKKLDYVTPFTIYER